MLNKRFASSPFQNLNKYIVNVMLQKCEIDDCSVVQTHNIYHM
jgi:hypothetical protein